VFTTGISPTTQTVLVSLAKLPFLGKFYLAGGTACALYYGHRLSYDLDFFSPELEDPRLITQILTQVGQLKVDQQSEGTWLGELDGVKLSFFLHIYPAVGHEEKYEGVRIASKMDIACMKLEAIASRGIQRDFIDMFYLARELGMQQILSASERKYTKADFSMTRFLRSLIYFVDAEKSETPRMLYPLDWDEVKVYFEKEVKRLAEAWGL